MAGKPLVYSEAPLGLGFLGTSELCPSKHFTVVWEDFTII